jgi:hypothetical protein
MPYLEVAGVEMNKIAEFIEDDDLFLRPQEYLFGLCRIQMPTYISRRIGRHHHSLVLIHAEN